MLELKVRRKMENAMLAGDYELVNVTATGAGIGDCFCPDCPELKGLPPARFIKHRETAHGVSNWWKTICELKPD